MSSEQSFVLGQGQRLGAMPDIPGYHSIAGPTRNGFQPCLGTASTEPSDSETASKHVRRHLDARTRRTARKHLLDAIVGQSTFRCEPQVGECRHAMSSTFDEPPKDGNVCLVSERHDSGPVGFGVAQHDLLGVQQVVDMQRCEFAASHTCVPQREDDRPVSGAEHAGGARGEQSVPLCLTDASLWAFRTFRTCHPHKRAFRACDGLVEGSEGKPSPVRHMWCGAAGKESQHILSPDAVHVAIGDDQQVDNVSSVLVENPGTAAVGAPVVRPKLKLHIHACPFPPDGVNLPGVAVSPYRRGRIPWVGYDWGERGDLNPRPSGPQPCLKAEGTVGWWDDQVGLLDRLAPNVNSVARSLRSQEWFDVTGVALLSCGRFGGHDD